MLQDYFNLLPKMPTLCDQFKAYVVDRCFTEEDQSGIKKEKLAIGEGEKLFYFCFLPRYVQHYRTIKACVEASYLFDISAINLNGAELGRRIHALQTPHVVRFKSSFEDDVSFVGEVFKDAQSGIHSKTRLLSSEEKKRMNEAIHAFLEGCYYSTVAMAVSSIEFVLLDLMVKQNPNEEKSLEQMPLGQLIREYLDNRAKYHEVIPKKHVPLLELCNVYRIFAVHPKKEKIGKSDASAVLSLTLKFLFDEQLRAQTP